ncbi:MAG: hypothetical protein ACLFUU_01460 [Desulfobacteraceae bacterium]
MSADAVYFWANWVLIGALILGIVATYAIVVSGNIRDTALKRELAAQSARTAEAELALEKLKAPRFLNEKQMHSLIARMKEFKGERVSIGVIPFNFEGASLADQIIRALKQLVWKQDLPKGPQSAKLDQQTVLWLAQ